MKTKTVKRGARKALCLALAAVVALGALALGAVPARAATTLAVGDYLYFGTYSGSPILWRVTGVSGSNATLLSEYTLDNKSYHNSEPTPPTSLTDTSFTYLQSDLYGYVQGLKTDSSYFTTGVDGEQAAITSITLPTDGSYGGAKDTNGNNWNYWLARDPTVREWSGSYYWAADYVNDGGGVEQHSVDNDFGVRPALTVNLNADIFTSEAVTVSKLTAVSNSDTTGHRAGEARAQNLGISVSGQNAAAGDVVRVTLTSGANTITANHTLQAGDLSGGTFTNLAVSIPAASFDGKPAGSYAVSASLIKLAGAAETVLSTATATNNYPITAAAAIGAVTPGATGHTQGAAPAAGLNVSVAATNTKSTDVLTVELLDSSQAAQATLTLGANASPFAVNIPQTQLTGLAPGSYTVRATLKNGAGAQLAQVTSGTSYVVAAAPTAPTLTPGTATRSSDTAATVPFTSSEAGTYYYLVQSTAASAPTDATVVKNNGTSGTMTAGSNTISLTALAAGAAKIYIVGEDAVGTQSDVLAMAIPPDHTATQTPGTIGAGTDAVFTFNGNYTYLAGVKLTHSGGTVYDFTMGADSSGTRALSIGGASAGKAESGSVEVTLYAAWLDTLPAGSYTLTVSFSDNGVQSSGSAGLTLTRAQGGTTTSTTTQDSTTAATGGSPQTGDNSDVGPWVAMLALSALGLGLGVWLAVRRHRRKTGKRNET